MLTRNRVLVNLSRLAIEQDLDKNKTTGGYSYDISATISPTGISCLASNYCSSQDLPFGKLLITFPPSQPA